MAYATDARSAKGTLAERFAAFRADLADRRAKAAVYRRTFDELNAMTERELNDIGIKQGMIREIAREAAYGK
jgi:uncharacterized protein YjiS (DUF1127 family)